MSHVDFLEGIPGKAVTMKLPVKCEGTPAGVREGGKLQIKQRYVEARGAIEKMPEALNLDVAKMNLGDTIKISDLKYDGLTFLAAPNITIVACRITRNVVEEVAPVAATTAAPVA